MPKGHSVGKDFVAGMDPFGIKTTQYGQQAQRRKESEVKHGVRRGVGTIGGLAGGAVLVPSAITGLVGGIQGAPGGVRGIARGFAQGAASPIRGLVRGKSAKEAIKRMGKSSDKVKVDEATKRVSALFPKKYQLAAETLEIEAREARQAVKAKVQKELRQAADKKAVLEKEMRQAAGKVDDIAGGSRDSKALDEGKKKVEGTASRAMGALEAAAERASQASYKKRAEGLRKAAPLVDEAYSSAKSQIALGGTIGAGGAFVQYGKGRESERGFAKRLKKARRMKKTASSLEDSFEDAIFYIAEHQPTIFQALDKLAYHAGSDAPEDLKEDVRTGEDDEEERKLEPGTVEKARRAR